MNSLHCKLYNYKINSTNYYTAIINTSNSIFQATQTRFADVLGNKDALLAAVSCPKFKLRWLRDEGRRQVKELLIAECGTIAPVAEKTASAPTKSAIPGDRMDFFG